MTDETPVMGVEEQPQVQFECILEVLVQNCAPYLPLSSCHPLGFFVFFENKE